MKTAISIPDQIFERGEKAAKDLKMSRSELYTTALHEFLNERQSTQITDRLDEVYEQERSSLDPVIAHLQALSLPPEEW